ncbi:imidazoleglycerol-phosphate dehydratase HisB [Candidatus Micrarchaeota archaeon]|nr:imidazoleglycerol-phosphate dehydratase HisB [Candidatus Micrarchaeota archaeon]MBI5176642.1 imidazoleglycerol-phosphate dehydratase HisB [Candidatus Micrarchaeota archaeon]
MRSSRTERKTQETAVSAGLELDGTGDFETDTGVPFFDHMLSQFAKQGLFDLKLKAKGDLKVDAHHTVEDVGIVLGEAFRQALGDKLGVERYGFSNCPMDESLASVTVDISGRSCCVFSASFARQEIGGMPTENVRDFFEAFTRSCPCAVNIQIICGENDHHKIEAVFKAFGRAMRDACAINPRVEGKIQSTKGIL